MLKQQDDRGNGIHLTKQTSKHTLVHLSKETIRSRDTAYRTCVVSGTVFLCKDRSVKVWLGFVLLLFFNYIRKIIIQ